MPAEPLIEAMDSVSHLIVLSPHLDDAVLSCGALMNYARKDMPVTVATFFTEGGAPPYTLSARCYLRQTRTCDANSLYLARRAEDRAVLEGAAISYLHAGLTEALFRHRTRPLLDRLPWTGRLIPELSHTYPTYRLHITRGRISPYDASTLRRILDTIIHLSLKSSTLFLAPLAVGGHVDHILVRTAAELSRKRVAYYSDFPYNMRYRADQSFVQRNALVQAPWSRDLTAKPALIRAYRTQADALFPGGEIPVVPEVYLLPGQHQGCRPWLSDMVWPMRGKGKAPRVLLLTSSPLEGHEGADKQLATAIANGIPQAEYVWFTRWPGDGKPRLTHGRRIPLLSKDGVPRLPERLQVTVAAAALARRTDLVHAVMTIGGSFPVFSRLGRYLFGGRPVIHTVPGVKDVGLLRNTRPLGVTVALSDATASELRAAGFGDVRVIPPAVALDKWCWQPRRDGPPVVLFAGHYDAGGGASEAIAAAGAAARAGAQFGLVLAMRRRPGQDVRGLNHELMAQAHREALGKVEILGHVSDMYGLLASADVVLFPPRALSGKADVPLTILEAMATGRPVILSDLPQFALLGDAVLRVPVGNSELTGGILARLLNQPPYWDAVATKGRKTVEERFGPERFAKRYLQLYQEVMSRFGSGGSL